MNVFKYINIQISLTVYVDGHVTKLQCTIYEWKKSLASSRKRRCRYGLSRVVRQQIQILSMQFLYEFIWNRFSTINLLLSCQCLLIWGGICFIIFIETIWVCDGRPSCRSIDSSWAPSTCRTSSDHTIYGHKTDSWLSLVDSIRT